MRISCICPNNSVDQTCPVHRNSSASTTTPTPDLVERAQEALKVPGNTAARSYLLSMCVDRITELEAELARCVCRHGTAEQLDDNAHMTPPPDVPR